MTDPDARSRKAFDLEERTARFGASVIAFGEKVRKSAITRPLVTQLIRAATSVGANYCEADDSESGRDFHHKVGLCRKESHEAKHWLRMIATADPSVADEARILWQEAKELNLIFGAIFRRMTKS